jgi:DNA-binding GntR family transcriptional regulator
MSLNPPEALSGVQQQLTATLRASILRGDFPPGSRLRQVEVADRFGVSPVPLREALTALEREGLVLRRPRRGWFVVQLEEDEITEIFELRLLLEQKAIHDALERITEEDISELEALTERLVHAADPLQHFELRERFYSTLYGASGKRQLVSMILGLHNQLVMHLRLQRVHDSNHAHEELMDAVRARDIQQASDLIAAHLNDICARAIAASHSAQTDAGAAG